MLCCLNHPFQPPSERSVVFLAFTAEEFGLLGSISFRAGLDLVDGGVAAGKAAADEYIGETLSLTSGPRLGISAAWLPTPIYCTQSVASLLIRENGLSGWKGPNLRRFVIPMRTFGSHEGVHMRQLHHVPLKQIVERRVTYKELTGKTAVAGR
jgi:Peptidase family M28